MALSATSSAASSTVASSAPTNMLRNNRTMKPPRSMRRPMSAKRQPGPWVMFSMTRPENAEKPSSNELTVSSASLGSLTRRAVTGFDAGARRARRLGRHQKTHELVLDTWAGPHQGAANQFQVVFQRREQRANFRRATAGVVDAAR